MYVEFTLPISFFDKPRAAKLGCQFRIQKKHRNGPSIESTEKIAPISSLPQAFRNFEDASTMQTDDFVG